MTFGQLTQTVGQPAAVGDWAVEQPMDRADFQGTEVLCREQNGSVCLSHGMVGTMHAGHVAQAAVAAV